MVSLRLRREVIYALASAHIDHNSLRSQPSPLEVVWAACPQRLRLSRFLLFFRFVLAIYSSYYCLRQLGVMGEILRFTVCRFCFFVFSADFFSRGAIWDSGTATPAGCRKFRQVQPGMSQHSYPRRRGRGRRVVSPLVS